MTTFTTSLDKFNKITTIIVSAILLMVLMLVFFLTPTDGQNVAKSISIIPIIAFIIVYLLRPNNYSVSADKLLIHRMINNVEIDINNIQSVQEIDVSKVKNSLRTFGVGGLFGSFGKFWNSTMGNMTWYVTRKTTLF